MKSKSKSANRSTGKIIAIVGVIALVASAYWYQRKSRIEKGQADFAEVQQLVAARQQAAMARPVAAAFQKNDIEFLVGSINEQRPAKEMEEFFNDAIFALDREGVSRLSAEAGARLRDHTLKYLKLKAADQNRGHAARARTLAIRVLGRLPAPEVGSPQYKSAIEFTRSTDRDAHIHFPLLEYIATWKPFPRDLEAHLLKKVYSAKLDESIFAINILSRMTDMEASKRLSERLSKSISSVPKNNQPFVVKLLSTSPATRGTDLGPLVQLSLQNLGDPAWEDVYVSIFEQNPGQVLDRRSLSKLMDSSNNPLLKKRIGRLLASVPPKGSKGQ